MSGEDRQDAVAQASSLCLEKTGKKAVGQASSLCLEKTGKMP